MNTPTHPTPPLSLQTANGLTASVQNGGIAALEINGRSLPVAAPGGFGVIDQATAAKGRQTFEALPSPTDNPLFYRGISKEAGIEVEALFTATPSCIAIRGKITDTRGEDRAIALSYSIPIDAVGWLWDDDIRRSRTITSGIYERTEPAACGSERISVYPLAAIRDQHSGLALAMDMAKPAQFQLFYNADQKALTLSYDYALVPETENFPSAAEFSFVVFPCDPNWGFRSAHETYMKVYADAYAVRSREQGIWMPFALISDIENWQDFGFRYHEGGEPDHAFDRQNNILPFRYTEPFTWWMRMPEGMPRTYEAARAEHQRILREETGRQHDMAAAMENSAMMDIDGKWAVSFHNLPWCNGACWILNPNPEQTTHPNGSTVNWSPMLSEKRHYASSLLAGEYIDSVEGYTTPELNYRRDHFQSSTVPLSYEPKTLKPGLFKGLAVFEFARKMSEDMHRMGKLLFGNGVPYRFSWLSSVFDIMGTETVWLSETDEYAPPPDAQLAFWRVLCGSKPYLLLQNTRFTAFDSSMVERYFQNCLFYGIYPSMFSVDAASDPYWRDPTLYNRDRELFKKYQPLIREVGEAGWQPITLAQSDNANIFVERFGDGSQGKTLITLFNETTESQSGNIQIDWPIAGRASERVTGATIKPDPSGCYPITIEPQSTRVLAFEASNSQTRTAHLGDGPASLSGYSPTDT